MNQGQNKYISKDEDVISDMFNDVSLRYDSLNKILSLGIDCRWRKTLVKRLKPYKPGHVLDIATGTGDLAIRVAKLKPRSILAVDISENMLNIGRKKVKKKKLDGHIKFLNASCSNLPFDDESFDTVVMSFGARNFKDPAKAMKEIYRVMKDDGVLMILEFGLPANPVIRIPFLFYFTKLLPFLGGLLSGNKQAYSYLTSSVKSFVWGDGFLDILKEQGFVELTYEKCFLGVTFLYIARKKSLVVDN